MAKMIVSEREYIPAEMLRAWSDGALQFLLHEQKSTHRYSHQTVTTALAILAARQHHQIENSCSKGYKLREVRLAKGKTQTEVAAALGMTQQQYSKYENGKNELPARRLVELALYYNVSADVLLGIESIGTQLTPSWHGKYCLGNGEHWGIECQCDECDHFLTCFPEV